MTNDDAVAAAVKTLREYGWTERYRSDVPGKNSRLDEIQAAVLRVKLAYLDDDTARRRRVAAFYDGALASCGALSLPDPDPSHVYHQYVVRSPARDELLRHLGAQQIGTLVHYPYAVHQQPAYRGRLALGPGGLSASEEAAREVLSLPMFPQLSERDMGAVAVAIKSWISRRST